MGGGDDLAAALLDLQALTERLRRECPWDRAQTARTIVPHTVEEAYEVADAALAGEAVKLLDELGDLLFQVFFLALLLEEAGEGDLAVAARQIEAKLVRRHPHVFADASVESAGAVKRRWEELKTEQEDRAGIFHDVPDSLPALLHAKKVQRRAATVGFEYEHAGQALGDLRGEIDELQAELGPVDPPAETEPDPRHEAELGDVLFASRERLATPQRRPRARPPAGERPVRLPCRGARQSWPARTTPTSPSCHWPSRTGTTTERRRANGDEQQDRPRFRAAGPRLAGESDGRGRRRPRVGRRRAGRRPVGCVDRPLRGSRAEGRRRRRVSREGRPPGGFERRRA